MTDHYDREDHFNPESAASLTRAAPDACWVRGKVQAGVTRNRGVP